MNLFENVQSATEADILLHLQVCSHQFEPPLERRLDLQAYAAKIGAHAVTFELWHQITLVGLVAAYFNDLVTRVGFITHVCVLDNYAGQGHASALLNKTIDYARAHRFTSIRLEVYPQNEGARLLYKKLKFNELTDIRAEGKILMERIL